MSRVSHEFDVTEQAMKISIDGGRVHTLSIDLLDELSLDLDVVIAIGLGNIEEIQKLAKAEYERAKNEDIKQNAGRKPTYEQYVLTQAEQRYAELLKLEQAQRLTDAVNRGQVQYGSGILGSAGSFFGNWL